MGMVWRNKMVQRAYDFFFFDSNAHESVIIGTKPAVVDLNPFPAWPLLISSEIEKRLILSLELYIDPMAVDKKVIIYDNYKNRTT